MTAQNTDKTWDFVIIGSGFGGSVSALRLAEKGYSVLVLEKGKRWHADDFPKTNWNLRRWLWLPKLGLTGFFKMTFMRHITILSGVGVGGGSLVYANTLPVPKTSFFKSPSWAHLADWQNELAPHYRTAKRMLGAARFPHVTLGDRIIGEIAAETGRAQQHEPTEVGVYFGEPGKTVPDPFFDGKGPERTGCKLCGACMTGCRHGAKNTLDKNYLYLAEQLGVTVQPESEVVAVRPQQVAGNHDGNHDGNQNDGYVLEIKRGLGNFRRNQTVRAKQIVFAGGVLGTLPLLLNMQADSKGLPKLSAKLGLMVRTNNESLLGVVTPRNDLDFTEGIAITSILNTSDDSHLEPVRYGRGSGFFRLLALPYAPGPNVIARLWGVVRGFAAKPGHWAKILTRPGFSERSQVLLYMQTFDSTLAFVMSRGLLTGFQRGLVSRAQDGQTPQAFLPEATDLANRFAEKIDGVTMAMLPETLFAIPSTAHILGGCSMGINSQEGVIDAYHRVHGYQGLYVIDGSAVSANPGVNPSLTITALAERAMAAIAPKGA